MAKTSNVFVRVEPEIKAQAERILDQLGIPMSNAIGIFLKQVVLQRGIPFDMKLPKSKPLVYDSLTEGELNVALEKGYADLAAGNVRSSQAVAERMTQDYGI